VEFLILGTVEVRVAGRSVNAGHAKQRSVLAVLLLGLGRIVPVELLIDRVWGEKPPKSVRNVVYGYVARLRTTIGSAGDSCVSITRCQGGYMLQADPEQVDVFRFRRMVSEAGPPGQDDERAAALLQDALGLWRGPALAGLDSPWLAGMRDALELERVTAVRDLTDIRLRQGQHNMLVSELAEQAAAAPADERLISQLLLALYRCGRPAEALRWFERTRLHLADELGTDPGPELGTLHQRILTADPTLKTMEPPRRAVSDPAGGAPRQLPAAVAHFVGRADELAALTELLDLPGGQSPRPIVISAVSGTAGVGKTALAVHWAHQVAGRFPDGQLYADLRAFDPSGSPAVPADVARRFLNALGIPDRQIPPDPDSWENLYRSSLAGKQMLIVLDNARDAAQVRPLLPGGPGCFVLVTSRNELTSLVASEGAHMLTVDLLSQPDAYELVAGRLDRRRVADEPEGVSELIELCARLPIAISIAVARAAAHPAFPLADLAAELRDLNSRIDVLDVSDPGSGIRAVFSWSYQELSDTAARMFRLLGAHPGPDISLPAATSLAGLARDQARRAVGELTRSHLLAEHVHGRFTFHDLLRAYAADRCRSQDDDAERDAALHRLLDHYLHTCHTVSRLLDPTLGTISLAPPLPGVLPEAPGGYEQAWAWAEAEHEMLLAVAALAAATHFEAYAWQILHAMEPFFRQRGFWHDFAIAQRTALDAAERTRDIAGQAHMHRGLGREYAILGSFEEGQAHLSHAIAGFQKLGYRTDQARAHINMGLALEMQGRYDEAISQAARALRLYRAAGHHGGQAGALNNIGLYHIYLGNHQKGIAYCQQALSGFGELGDRLGTAHALDSLGSAYHFLGQSAQAIACYQQSLDTFREYGDRFGQADALTHLGDTHHATGNPQAARRTWQAALNILSELHHPGTGRIYAKLTKTSGIRHLSGDGHDVIGDTASADRPSRLGG
jgi:DNA-binding SARP family transcriptional activator/tetratricopeptide (TPR) repeat protein